jgi:hypothetical protein
MVTIDTIYYFPEVLPLLESGLHAEKISIPTVLTAGLYRMEFPPHPISECIQQWILGYSDMKEH